MGTNEKIGGLQTRDKSGDERTVVVENREARSLVGGFAFAII